MKKKINEETKPKMTPYLATAIAEGFCEGEGASEEQQIEAWQFLHDTGLAYRLQGWFGRQARELLAQGVITDKGQLPELVKSEGKTYQIFGEMAFDEKTPFEVIRILIRANNTGQKLKLYYGDAETGADWCEEYDTIGTIGRSTGDFKIPLLIKSARSMGGGAVLDGCIVKIVDFKTKKVLYQHAKYVAPVIEIVASDMAEYKFNTIINGTLHGRHKTLRSAQMCKAKIQ